MALQKHFGNAGGEAEVPVNLERGMGAPKVFENGCFEYLSNDFTAFFALAESCSAKQSVCKRPARRFDSSVIKRGGSRRLKPGRFVRNLRKRIKSEQVGDVPVLLLNAEQLSPESKAVLVCPFFY